MHPSHVFGNCSVALTSNASRISSHTQSDNLRPLTLNAELVATRRISHRDGDTPLRVG
jgi:hypothetical protein